MKVLLDTDILSEVMKGRNPEVQRTAQQYLSLFGRLTISSVTITEVVKGFQKTRDERRLLSFLEFLEQNDTLPLGIKEAAHAGRIVGDLERQGIPIGHMDPLIAATALVHQMPLVTGNTRHFIRIRELGYPLILQNWREAPHG
jgi:predicted nucleic acid-binding protein